MRVFNELKGKRYDELTAPYEKFLPGYFGKLGEAYKDYPEATENEEYNLYVYYNKWPIRKLEYSYVISKMQEAIFDGAKVLEAGCGVSSMPFLWSEFGGKITAVDFDEKSIALMRKFSEDAFFGEGREIETAVCDIMQLPYEDNSFDVVVSTSVLEHLPYPNYLLAVNELYRVLKPGGTLVCTCDLDASENSKRRAMGAFSAQDIKKILGEFKGELVEEEMAVEEFSITEKEIEQFWIQHYYDGIGYEGNRGYVAVGFHIKKSFETDKKQQLLKYEELIEELIRYETTVTGLHNDLQKANEYGRKLEEEKKESLCNHEKISKESDKRLKDLEMVTRESEERSRDIEKLTIQKEQLLAAMKEQAGSFAADKQQCLENISKITAESEERLKEIEKLTAEKEQLLAAMQEKIDSLVKEKQQCLQDLAKVSAESEQRAKDLQKVSEESEQRLEAIEYLKTMLQAKE